MKKLKSLLDIIPKIPSKTFRQFKKYSLKKKIFIVIVGLIIFLVLSAAIGNLNQKPDYTTTRVEKGSVTEIVSETGNIIANGRIDVYSPTNGIVTEIFVKNGDSVTEGQNLFTVKSSATEQEEQSAYATYLTAQTTLNAAQSNSNVLRADMYAKWDTFRDLATGDEFETGDNKPKEKERIESPLFQIAQDNWIAAEKKYKDQQTVVAQGNAQVSSAWLLYQATQDAIVKAPLSGTVSNLSISIGNSVDAKTQTTLTQTPKASLIISNTSDTEVKVSLSENDINKIAEGQTASIDIDAIANKNYQGKVVRVDSIGLEDNGVLRFNVYIQILNPDGNIRSGMGADVTITTNKVTDVLTVPNSAVKPYQGGRGVRVPDTGEKIKYIPVIVGVKGETKTQIIDGLSQGQEIITSVSNENIKRAGLFGN